MGGVVGNLQKHHTACNGRKTKKRQNWTLLLPVRGQPSTTHGGNKLNSAKGHI